MPTGTSETLMSCAPQRTCECDRGEEERVCHTDGDGITGPVVSQLAPGRFRLGVGPSHRPIIEAMGIPFASPLGHLHEYLRILKALLQQGRMDIDGTYYKAHETIPDPLDLPVMASALQHGSFELCGEEADGAIS